MARRKQERSAEALSLVPELLTLAQAASRAGRTQRTLQNWVKVGILEHRWVGNIMVTTMAALEAAIANAPTQGRPRKDKTTDGSK